MAVSRVETPWGGVYEIEHPDTATQEDLFRYVQQNRQTLEAMPPQGEQSVLGTVREAAKGVPRGFLSGFLTAGEGLAELSDAATDIVGLEGLVDSGEENELVRLSRGAKAALNESFLGRDPAYRDSFVADVGEGLGSFATFLTPAAGVRMLGLAGQGAKAVGLGGATGLATGTGAGEQAERIRQAREQGIEVDADTENAAIGAGALVGLSELAPVGRLLKRVSNRADKQTRDTIMETLTSALKQGGAEAAQEAAAGLAQDLVERGLYNESLPVGESLWDDFTVGGAVGTIADLVAAGATGRKRQAITEAQRRREERLRLEREDSIQRTLADMQKPAEQREAETEALDTAAIDIEPEAPVTDRLSADQYAMQIARTMGYGFPSGPTLFNVTENDQGDVVVTDDQGTVYGQPFQDYELAFSFASSLSDQVADQQVRNAVETTIRTSPDAYTPEQTPTLVEYGRRILSPSENTVNALELDEAAGTTQENGFFQLVEDEDGEARFATLNEARRRKKKLTASQRLNAERKKRGLPETDNFTMSEVRSVLGEDVAPLIDDSLLSPTDRGVLAKKKPGENRIRRLLRAKNITSDLGSPELEPLTRALIGKGEIETRDDRVLFYTRMAQMPRFDEPTKLPTFEFRPYTAEQFERVVAAGAPESLSEVRRIARITTTDPEGDRKAEALLRDVRAQGVEPADPRKLPVPVATPQRALGQLTENLQQSLRERGLPEIGVRISNEFGEEAAFDPFTKAVVFSVDAVDPEGTLTDAQLEGAFADLLHHEQIHALRELDLFEQDEWSSLERAVLEQQRPDAPVSYMEAARATYPELSDVEVVEEAVSEFVRDVTAGRKKIGGQPRSLIRRIMDFFKGMKEAIRGTSLPSYQDVVGRIERGEIGGRERGRIRTLRLTEETQRRLPDRLKGVARDNRFLESVPAEQAPEWVPRPRAARRTGRVRYEQDDPAIYQIDPSLTPADKRRRAEEMGFDPRIVWYHGTLTDIEEFAEGSPGGYLGRYIYFTSSPLDAVENYAIDEGPDQLAKIEFVKDEMVDAVTEGPDAEAEFLDIMGRLVALAEGDFPDEITVDDVDPVPAYDSYADAVEQDPDLAEEAVTLMAREQLGWTNDGVVYPVYTRGNYVNVMSENTVHTDFSDGQFDEEFTTPTPIDATQEDIAAIVENLLDTEYSSSNPRALENFIDELDFAFEMAESRNDRDYITGDELYQLLRDNMGVVSLEDMDAVPPGVRQNPDVRGDLIATVFRDLGFDGINMDATVFAGTPGFGEGMPGTENQIHRIVFEPKNIRSIVAKFDPAQTDSPKIRAARRARTDLALQRQQKAQRAIDDRVETAKQEGPVHGTLVRTMLSRNQNDTVTAQAQMKPMWLGFQTPTYTWKEKLLYNAADKLIGLKQVVQSINEARRARGLDPISATDDPYLGEESLSGRIGYEARRFEEQEVRPLAEEIVELGLTREELDEFLILRHAPERNAQIRRINPSMPDGGAGSIVTADGQLQRLTDGYVIQRMRDDFGLSLENGEWTGGNDRAKRLMQVADRVDRMVKESVYRGQASGLYSEQDAEQLTSFYRYYVPLKGEAEIPGEDKEPVEVPRPETAGSGGSMNIRGKEARRALGREGAAFSPLASVISDRQRMIARANKNEHFGQRLMKLIEDNPNESFWKIIRPGDSFQVRMLNAKGDEVVVRGMAPPFASQAQAQGLLGVKRDGEQYYVQIEDQRLMDAMMNLDGNSGNKILQSLGGFNRFLSVMNTSLNPEFVVGNFARDVQTAIYNIIGEQTMEYGKAKGQKLVRRVVRDTLPSISQFYKGTRNPASMSPEDRRNFEQFMMYGAKADWFHSRPPEETAKTIDSLIAMQQGTFEGNFRARMSAIKDLIEDTNSAVENGVRFASFKAARDAFLEAGDPEDMAASKAASLAKNLTVNFNRKGQMGNTMNSLYLFFNASVQGTMNFARGMNVFDPQSSRVKQGIVGSMIGFGALTAALAQAMAGDDEESGRTYYELIPDYVKERNLVFMKPDGKEYWTVPLPYGYNAFHVLGMNLYETTAGLRSIADAAQMSAFTFLGSFNPIGFATSEDFLVAAAKTGVPTAGVPIVELLANENFFGAPIYKENFPLGAQLPDSSLSFSTTPEAFKQAAEIINALTGGNRSEPGMADISPGTLDYMFEFALGGAGATGMRSVEAVRRAFTGEEITPNEIPFFRRIKGETDARTLQEDYYDRKITLQRKEAQAEFLPPQERPAYVQRNRDYLRMVGVLRAHERRLKKLREQLDQARQMAAYSPENALRARELEEVIEERMDAEYARFNRTYDEVVGRTR